MTPAQEQLRHDYALKIQDACDVETVERLMTEWADEQVKLLCRELGERIARVNLKNNAKCTSGTRKT
jgi:hypothetical protein